jgi:hypothetical protein
MKSNTPMYLRGKKPLSLKEFNDLFSDEITIKRQNELLIKLNDRVHYMVLKTADMLNLKVEWYDFNNGDPRKEKDGHFDKNLYVRAIAFNGKFNQIKSKPDLLEEDIDENGLFVTNYNFEVPTSWLHKNFELELEAIIYEHKQELKILKKQDEEMKANNLKTRKKNTKKKVIKR